MNVQPFNDAETIRLQRNLTQNQKRAVATTKEGVVVNSLIKEPSFSVDELCDSLIISEQMPLPKKINENKASKGRSILPITALAVGVSAGITLLTALIKRNAKINLAIDPAKKLPSLTRNLAINEETHQAIYQMVQCPNQKTILAGTGVLALSAMAFMGKTFIDGFKDVWVRKQEADIQKNLQENLIEVETQSFSGKIQIMRNMLSRKAQEFNEFLCVDKKKCCEVNFKGKDAQDKEKSNGWKYFALGAASLTSIVGLGFASMKNLSKSKKFLETYILKSQDTIENIVKNSTKATQKADKTDLEGLLQSIDATPEYIRKTLSKLNWENSEKETFVERVIFNSKKATAKADSAIGGDGTPKPAFYSHVNDYRAFFYNWLLDTSNPLMRNLFLGVTGVTAATYGGKVAGDAIKEVQVKKYNAQTELELQQNLVSTELRNFKSKKDSAIEPLCKEFYTQAAKDKPRQELKNMAESILLEVKNGAPFIYS